MKTLIICFSQTGNTQKVAESIRDGIISVTGQCDLRPLAEVKGSLLKEYDLVGLGCPVFYYQEPFNIREFIDGLPALKNQQWFVFCSHGSIMGNAINSMAERLRRKGALVIGYHDTYADGTLPFYPYPTLTTGHPDDTDLRDAKAFGKMIAQRSQRLAEGDLSKVPALESVPEDWVRMADLLSREFLEQSMPRFRVNMEKCTRCGSCEAACPVQGIDIETQRIQQPCVYCCYCVKICPILAIEADWDMLVQMAPQNYAKYREALDAAASKGKFRWLVNPDSMNFDDPLHKQRERELGQ